jgi:hypothetical protein
MPTVFIIAPVALSLLAVLVLRLGWPRAAGYRHPSRYRLGVGLVAAGLLGVWLVPLGLSVTTGGLPMELRGLLYFVGLGFAFGAAGSGIDMLSKANDTPRDDSWDDLASRF